MRSGVADYSADLIPALARQFDITIFAPIERPTPCDGLSVRPLRALSRPDDFDVLLYQLGNDVRLEPVRRLALEHPGVVILHDPVLHPLVAELTWARGDRPAFWRELALAEGRSTADRILDYESRETVYDVTAHPLSSRLVRSSMLTLVHSRYAANLLRRFSPGAAIRVFDMPASGARRQAKTEARRALSISDETFLVGVFGFATAEKRFHILLPAFRAMRSRVPTGRLVVVGGETESCPLASMITLRRMERIVDVTGWVDETRLGQYLDAVDASVHLRQPTMGETSASVVRCLAVGQPLIVSEAGWFAELPDDCAIKVPVDDAEVESLAAALVRLASDPALAERMTQAALAYTASRLDLNRAARAVGESILSVAEGRIGARRGKPDRSDLATTEQVSTEQFELAGSSQ